MLEAFPFDTAPRYLLRDRDGIYGQEFCDQIKVMNINEVLGDPRSPWQRASVERVIGSIRRECLDHVITFNEDSLRRTLLFVLFLLPSISPSSFVAERLTRITPRSCGRKSDRNSRSRRAIIATRASPSYF